MAQQWITDRAFIPTLGSEYEIGFGEIMHQGKTGHSTARIRIDGETPKQWIDLDTNLPLDPELAK